jgi:hypothetical protein
VHTEVSRSSGEHDALVRLTEIVGQLQQQFTQLAETGSGQKLSQDRDQWDTRSQGFSRSDREASTDEETGVIHRRRVNRGNIKIPPYTGKEDWSVWICRFEEVANRYGWTVEDRLDQLLPRLHDDAADFVFGQLTREARGNYRKLIRELTHRFRKVETSRTYLSKFHNRSQKPGERVEDFAADLRRLYIKAHPERDSKIREEDLLRKFLDGLADRDAQFHVEFVKDPADIYEAVQQVVQYEEAGRPSTRKQSVREVKARQGNMETDAKPSKPHSTKPKSSRNVESNQESCYKGSASTIEAMQRQINEMMKALKDMASSGYARNKPRRSPTDKSPPNKRSCYYCNKEGHFIRECPKRISDLQIPEAQSNRD